MNDFWFTYWPLLFIGIMFIYVIILTFVTFGGLILLISGIRKLWYAIDSRIRESRGLPPRDLSKPADYPSQLPFYTHIHDEH